MKTVLAIMTLLFLGTGCSSDSKDQEKNAQSITQTPQPDVNEAYQPPQIPSIERE